MMSDNMGRISVVKTGSDHSPANGHRLVDKFGRKIINLRISVTDRCNFRCVYCMPAQGMEWMERKNLLTFEEIERLVTLFAELGIDRIRLTGGEPLMRKDLHELIRKIVAIPGIRNVGMTTNAYFLAEQAEKLAEAGLDRINISLDSLERQKFGKIVRRDLFDTVMKGIDAVACLPINPVKINVVVIKGVNEDEIPAFALLAKEKSFNVRFIEFMPLGADDDWGSEKVVPSSEVLKIINNVSPVVPLSDVGLHPAKTFRFEDGSGEIGVISSVSDPFCHTCNRIRITPDGQFRTCLFSINETDLKSLIRGGASDDEIKKVITGAVWEKEEGHLINSPDFKRPSRTMSQIGG